MTDKTKKILVVEDNPVLIKSEVFALEKEGFTVEVAMNGKEAMEKITIDNYSLIMLDLVMPEKTGFEVLQALKERGNKIPIIVFSNMFEEISKDEVLRLGAREYVVKSDISLDEMVEKVKKYTSK